MNAADTATHSKHFYFYFTQTDTVSLLTEQRGRSQRRARLQERRGLSGSAVFVFHTDTERRERAAQTTGLVLLLKEMSECAAGEIGYERR